jgi:ribonuclease HI
MEDLGMAGKESRTSSAPAPKPVAKWKPPPDGVMKLNADGAVAKTQCKGAVGVVCRDDRGAFQGASAMVFDGVTDPTTLEAYACREAMDLAEDLQVQRASFSSDCLTVVQEINSSSVLGHHGMIIRDIVQRRSRFQQTCFGHERREANVEAHTLAKYATTLNDYFLGDSFGE